ncbi:MAG: dihydroorotate dehydrogenase electron transfer subunit [Nitriliruptoraceae bacterium]
MTPPTTLPRGRDEPDAPVRERCEILSRRREGAYWLLTFSTSTIAARARAGQFVQLGVSAPHTLLRRPFSVARVSRQGPSAGTVEVVFDAHGPGTDWLAGVAVHDHLDVLGPLGRPFPLPQRKVTCLLVGGGYGLAPLLLLGQQLVAQGLRVDVLAGAASTDRLLGVIDAKRLSASSTFTTEDGSYGHAGRVTDVLDEVLTASGAGVVYACGPNPMLRAISEHCAQREIPVQVAVEELMACGVGVCFTCVLPVRGRDGAVRMKRACVDGPAFNGARIAWDVSRYASASGPEAGSSSGDGEVAAGVLGGELGADPSRDEGATDVGVGDVGTTDVGASDEQPDGEQLADETGLWGRR